MPHASRMTCVRKFQADRALRQMSCLVQNCAKNCAKNCCAGGAWLRNLGFCAKPLWAEPSRSRMHHARKALFFTLARRSIVTLVLQCASPWAQAPFLWGPLVPVRHILPCVHQEKHFCRAFPWRHMGETQILYPNCCSGIASLSILRNTIPYFAKVWRQFSSAGVGSTSSHRVLAVRRQWRIFTRTRTRLVWDSRWSPKRPRLCILI